MNLICFRHPEYQGTSSPVLSCKTCCGIFLTELKRQAEAKGDSANAAPEPQVSAGPQTL